LVNLPFNNNNIAVFDCGMVPCSRGGYWNWRNKLS